MAEQRKRFRSTSTIASNGEPGGCYDELLKYAGHLGRQIRRRFRRWRKRASKKHQRGKVMPAISLQKKKQKRTKAIHLHHHHHHHHLHYHFGNGHQAPRASPENSDIGSSPTRQNRLLVPATNGSIGPSSESLHSIAFCTENLSRLEPVISKSQSKSSPHHHVMATLSIHRASSINYPTTNSKDTSQNTALAKLTTERALNNMSDITPNKMQEKWKEIMSGVSDPFGKSGKLPHAKSDAVIRVRVHTGYHRYSCHGFWILFFFSLYWCLWK